MWVAEEHSPQVLQLAEQVLLRLHLHHLRAIDAGVHIVG